MEFNRRGRKQPEWRRAAGLVALLLILAFGGSIFNRTLGGIVLSLASPFLRFGNHLATTIRDADSALRAKQALVIENDQLKQRLVALEASLANHQILETDNQLLRQEIGLVHLPTAVTVVEILSHPWNSPFDIILAALPEGGTAARDSLVTFKQDVWAGNVIAQTGKVVKIKLISAPGSQIPVLIGPNNVPALAVGKGNGNLEVALPRNLEFGLGDLVVAADASRPQLVGTIGAIDKDPGESLQTILIRTPINLSFVHYLEIHGR